MLSLDSNGGSPFLCLNAKPIFSVRQNSDSQSSELVSKEVLVPPPLFCFTSAHDKADEYIIRRLTLGVVQNIHAKLQCFYLTSLCVLQESLKHGAWVLGLSAPKQRAPGLWSQPICLLAKEEK